MEEEEKKEKRRAAGEGPKEKEEKVLRVYIAAIADGRSGCGLTGAQ